MAERVVVSFRARGEAARDHDEAARLAIVRTVLKRAEAMGATVCSWGAVSFSLAFPPEDLEELIHLLADGELRATLANFSMGVSSGVVSAVVESRGTVELGLGAPIVRALALARAGEAGQVLLDARMSAVQSGQLVTGGSRLARAGGARIRGRRLDLGQPWKPAGAAWSEPRKVAVPYIGRADKLEHLQVEPGTLAIVRADPGLGGSRFLQECMLTAGGRSLLLEPGFLGEPLGALRRALARDAAGNGTVNLPHSDRTAYEAIARGDGADIGSAAELIEEWLAPPGARLPALVAIDDAHEVDAASLDVIAASMLGATRPFRCIARLDAVSALPAQLAPLPPGPEVELGPLEQGAAEQLAQALLGGATGPDATGWAAGGVPLVIHEAIGAALDTGELVRTLAGVEAHASECDGARPIEARGWIARRWARLDSQSRAMLQAIAVLGGAASRELVEALLRAAADGPVELEAAAGLLVRRGWLVEPQAGWLAVASRTHLQALLDVIPDPRRAAWHRAASLLIEAREGPLARAEAARHARLAHDRARAARLLVEASRAAAAAKLEGVALALEGMARVDEPRLAHHADSAWPRDSGRISLHAPASSFAAALLSRAPKDARESYPPVEIPLPLTASARPIPPPPGVPQIGAELAGSLEALVATLPSPALEAFSSQSLQALEAWAEREPMTEQRERLHNRLRAIVSIGKGDPGDALRVLREACDNAKELSVLEQSRSHLALAVGLAQAGRALESLVEALQALAHARSAAEPKAEKACVAFLQRIYVASGNGELANCWALAATD